MTNFDNVIPVNTVSNVSVPVFIYVVGREASSHWGIFLLVRSVGRYCSVLPNDIKSASFVVIMHHEISLTA
jgi:hypothetical protein